MNRFNYPICKAATALILTGALPHPRACAQEGLDSDLQKLIDKYGANSVAQKLQGKISKAGAKATHTKVPDDAVAAENKKKEPEGLFLDRAHKHPIYLRRSYDEAPAPQSSGSSKQSAGEDTHSIPADAAIFSYSYDYLTHSNQWSAIGSLIVPINLWSSSKPAATHGLELDQFDFLPSVSINRITNSRDKSKEVDELTFRAGFSADWVGSAWILNMLKLTGYATYVTNTNGDNGIIAGEFDLEPITDLYGNAARYQIKAIDDSKKDKSRSNTLIGFHWRAYLHTEFGGNTGSAFNKPSQTNTGEFFRVGPVVKLQLDPLFLQRMNASVKYSYLAGISGQPTASHYFSANIGYILDSNPDTQHWTLNASYDDGDTPLVKERVRLFVLSLGVKY